MLIAAEGGAVPLDRVYREDGVTKACVATEITFYLYSDDGTLPDCRDAYALAISELRSHVRWYRTDQMRRDHRIDPDAVRMLPFWCESPDPVRTEYGLHFGSGDSEEDVGPWGFEFWILEVEPRQFAGFFHLSLPFEAGQDEPERVADLVRSLADVLPFRSGHAGFGIQLDEGEDLEDRDRWARAWCRRNPGISVRDLIGSVGVVTHGIRNVSWITLVDQELLSAIGTLDSVCGQLGENVLAEERLCGCLLQAGNAPRLGDVNRRERLPLYRKVNAALRPIRIASHPPFPGFSDDETAEWLERLD